MNEENVDIELLLKIADEIIEEVNYLKYDINPIGTYPRKDIIKIQIGIIEKILQTLKEKV